MKKYDKRKKEDRGLILLGLLCDKKKLYESGQGKILRFSQHHKGCYDMVLTLFEELKNA